MQEYYNDNLKYTQFRSTSQRKSFTKGVATMWKGRCAIRRLQARNVHLVFIQALVNTGKAFFVV